MPQPEPFQAAPTRRRFPWRRLFQFRLRTILILTTIIAVWLGWWSHKARQQRDIVAALRKAGATVYYDTTLPWTSGYDAPGWPEWLLNSVGVDFFAGVYSVRFPDLSTEREVNLLQHLTSIHSLSLQHSTIGDHLAVVGTLTSLRHLDMFESGVTDDGLEHLENLRSLKTLHVKNNSFTEAGISRLKHSLPNCNIEH